MSDRPNDLLYTKTHEWIRVEGDTGTVGITDFAVEQLGDLVFIDLPEVGTDVVAGETIAEVESVKAAVGIEGPANGEVTEVHEDVADDQAPLVSDPYGEGWLFKMSITSLPDDLMDAEAYEKQLASEH